MLSIRFGGKCNQVWDLQTCKKVAMLTRSEQQEISEGFSMNWMNNNCKKCPKCQNHIIKVGIDHNRVKCNFCKYGDFCFFCLQVWKTGDTKFCGSNTCQTYIKTLKDAPLTRVFPVNKDKGKINVETPKFRACIFCETMLQHVQKCKHTKCKKCLKQFCWICLQPKELNSWKCGQPFDYCGVVAPRQKS